MSDLKPCPLCGGPATLEGGNETHADGACWWVQCADTACFCSIGCHYLSDDGVAATKAWNRRAQPAQVGHVPEASCGECGKKTSDGWALYCVACMEKAGLPAVTDSPPLTHSCTSSLGKTPDSTAQAVPLLSDDEIAAALPHEPGDLDFVCARAVEAAVRAKLGVAVPMTDQFSEGKFAPDAKLLELADKIDHEQNWRHSGIFQRDHLTQDQKDRVLAGVMLRRYADLMAPESWRLFPPKSVVSHSYRAATLDAVVKMAERHGIVGKEGA